MTTSHRKRLENLEALISPRQGRPFVIWGIDDEFTRLKTDQEIDAEIDAALAAGRMAASDQPIIVSWRLE
jgi:hypothetical protein